MADVFCKNLNTIVLPAMSDEHQMMFRKYLKYYVYAEMAETVNLEKYDCSNWDRSGKLTCCLCELYKIYIFEMDLIDAWLDRLHLSTKSHYSESNRDFQASMLLAATVLSRREPNEGSLKGLTKSAEESKATAPPKMTKSKYMGMMIIDTDKTFRINEMQ